jgi:ABC-type branched-subunit amino acid transport system ATPase component
MAQKMFKNIRDIAALGMSILLVEQNAMLAFQIAQRGYLMESALSPCRAQLANCWAAMRCSARTWGCNRITHGHVLNKSV